MYCEKCGTKNGDTDMFCANCGNRMDSAPAPQSHDMTQQVRPANQDYNQYNANQYHANQHNPNQYNANQYNLKQHNSREEASNMPLMILLSVSALILVGLIAFGAFLLFREPEETVVADEQPVAEAPAEVQMPTTAPTAAPVAEQQPVEQPVAEQPLAEAPVEEPVAVAPPVEAPSVEAPSEQARQSNPQRDSSALPQVATRNDFVFIDSNVRLITRGELDMLTAPQIRIARNELFARCGRVFEKQDMKEYFNNQAWYNGTVPASTFDANRGAYMNRTELDNMEIINQYERDYGINQ